MKVSRGWGHLITWNGPVIGHLNSFSALGGGNLNKNFPKIQMSERLPGGCLSFDLTGTLALFTKIDHSVMNRRIDKSRKNRDEETK